MRNKVRVQAFIWIIVLSLAYYGVRNGVLTLISGGNAHLEGPTGTVISDNNHMALALVISLPMLNYLRLTTKNTLVRKFLAVGMIFRALGVLGSYSRGGFIGLSAIAGYATIKFRKIGLAIVIMVLLFPALAFMPEKWTSRMDTISSAEEDGSFQNRLESWEVQYLIAEGRIFVGGGFSASQDFNVYSKYKPDAARS